MVFADSIPDEIDGEGLVNLDFKDYP